MSWIKGALFLVLGWLVMLGLGAVALEVTLGHWFSDDPWRATQSLNIIRGQRIAYDASRLGYQTEPVIYTRDAFGLRGDCTDRTAPSILTVGGSTTDQRYIPDGQTWQDVLQKDLREKTGKKNFCVWNAGVDGHSTYGHLAAFQNWFPLISLKPQIYLLNIGINDAGFRLKANKGYDYAHLPTGKELWDLSPKAYLVDQLRQKSAFYRLGALAAYFLGEPERAFTGHRLEPKEKSAYTEARTTEGVQALIAENTQGFAARFDAVLAEVKKAGGVAVCILQPHAMVHDFGEGPRGIKAAFPFEGVSYNGLDFDASLKALNKVIGEKCPHTIKATESLLSPSDFYDYVHATPEGAKKLGHAIAEGLEKEGLLDAVR